MPSADRDQEDPATSTGLVGFLGSSNASCAARVLNFSIYASVPPYPATAAAVDRRHVLATPYMGIIKSPALQAAD